MGGGARHKHPWQSPGSDQHQGTAQLPSSSYYYLKTTPVRLGTPNSCSSSSSTTATVINLKKLSTSCKELQYLSLQCFQTPCKYVSIFPAITLVLTVSILSESPGWSNTHKISRPSIQGVTNCFPNLTWLVAASPSLCSSCPKFAARL